jgi:3,4-dihydroxy 2-butanone 4-phosphate synthase/GTP cyclohydrolase II
VTVRARSKLRPIESAAFEHSVARFRSAFGPFHLHAYRFATAEHAALLRGTPGQDEAPLVRIQSSCLTGTAFHAELCDCRQQLHESMRLVAEAGSGVVLYLDQEGRSHGLVEKVAQLDLIADGYDTVDAAAMRGREGDLRRYHDAAAMLDHLIGDRPIRLLTNNPTKLACVQEAGITVDERLPIEVGPTDGNRAYLKVKKHRMGHLLERV